MEETQGRARVHSGRGAALAAFRPVNTVQAAVLLLMGGWIATQPGCLQAPLPARCGAVACSSTYSAG